MGHRRVMFLMCCICVSCHWGHCHEKTSDNNHDKQKYFDNAQSLDAAEEEPSETGTEEEPVLSVENSGRDSDVLRLESKLIWPELCFWDKINSQALRLFSTQEFVSFFHYFVKCKNALHISFFFSLPHYLLLEQIWYVYIPVFLMSLVYWVSHWKKKKAR